MNILLNNQIQRNRTLLDIMFGRNAQNTKNNKNVKSSRRDTVTISNEAQELSMKKSISGKTRNISIDSTIDLQKYVDAVREILENYQLSFSDWWFVVRIEHFIRQGKIRVVEDSEDAYVRLICLA